MTEEKKFVELEEEELEKVSGGGNGGVEAILFTAEAGYYRYRIGNPYLYYLPSNVTGDMTKQITFNVYALDPTTGYFVNNNTTISVYMPNFQTGYEKIPNPSSYNFVG